MSFRARLALVAATAVALAIVTASFVVYFIVKDQLRNPIDASLRRTAEQVQHAPGPEALGILFHLRSDLGGAPGYPQVVYASGEARRPPGAPVPLPVNNADRAVPRSKPKTFLRAAHLQGH